MVDAPANITQAQFANRFRSLLPLGWFPGPPQSGEKEAAPVLNALLQGAGSAFESVWQLLQYVYAQQRMATASGPMLNLYAQDLFEDGLPREVAETDTAYRSRIYNTLFPLRFTRRALEEALTGSWSEDWLIVEPRNASDTKGMASMAASSAGGGYGYGATGLRYGSRLTPFQGFVLLSGNSAVIPPTTVLAAIEKIRAGGVVIWVGNAAP